MKRTKWISLFSIVSLVLTLLPVYAWASDGATIRFVPSASTANVGDTVHVDVKIENVQNLYAIEAHISFDAARLQVLDDNPAQAGIQILPGSLFPKSDPSYVVLNQVDNTAGKIDFAITLLAPELPLAGSGTLASIRFAARAEGTAGLAWAFVQMADSNGQVIPHTGAGQNITISSPTTPEPGKDCADVIGNGGMEANTYWQMPVTPHKASYTSADRHSGARSVRLGIEPGAADVYSHSSAYQKIRIPANATSATLTFWARRFTQETPKGVLDPSGDLYDPAEVIEGTFDWTSKGQRAQEDWQEVLILEYPCYNWLATLMRTRSNDGAWTQYNYNLSAFAGQEIVVYFNAINNGNGLRTWMYVDDVQVQVCYDGAACGELVHNRSFEWTGSWAHPNTPRPADYTTAAAHTGARSMRLGVVPPTADVYSHSSAYQEIDVPTGALHPTLTFWYKAHSEEPPKSNWKDYDWSDYAPSKVIAGETREKCCGRVDWQEMLILDKDYKIVSGGVVLRQVQNDGQWKQVTYDLSPYKGMHIVLYFNVINDGNGKRTWMYVDDVSVNLCGHQVRFDPTSTQVGVGASFNMDVRIENTQNLYGIETTIRFNPAILEVTDADPAAPGVQVNRGSWLPASTHVVTNTVDNAGGLIRFAATLVSPAPALTGSGALVSIPFRAKATGNTPVAFDSLKVVDASATPLPANRLDGQVTVTGNQATLTGKALLEGRTDHSGILVQLAGGPSTTTGADGSYSLVTAPGTYTVTFSHASYLAQATTVTASAGATVNVPQVTLLGGDINADHKVDILDLAAVGAQFGSTSPSPPTVDINGDGRVDIIDIVLVAKNFQ